LIKKRPEQPAGVLEARLLRRDASGAGEAERLEVDTEGWIIARGGWHTCPPRFYGLFFATIAGS